MEFDGTQGKAFFGPDTTGAATVVIDGATFSVVGLKPLADGAQYQLMIVPTPVATEPTSHE